MRKEYRKAVRELFATSLLAELPGFEPVKVKSPVLFGGELVLRWAPSDTLHCFVLLVPDPKGRQAFTVEVAWSTSARFPEVTSRPSLLLGPGDPDPVEVEEGIIRLGDLAERSDMWWDLPDPALENPGDILALQRSLEPLGARVAMEHAAAPVEAAVGVLLRKGVGFLEELAERHCTEPRTPRMAP